MKPQAVLIGTTNIDWLAYLASCKELLNRSISKQVDSLGLPVQTATGFIATLAELSRPGSNPFHAVRDTSLIRHWHFVFLVATDKSTLDELLSKVAKVLSVTTAAEQNNEPILSVISGNMQEWQFAALACCTDKTSFNLRLLFDQVILIFDQVGLSALFEDFRRQAMPDRTFELRRIT